MNSSLKRLASRLPAPMQLALRRVHFARQIRSDQFGADEPEVRLLPDLVGRGDWVIDVGANVGHYTLALAKLVGEEGRVIAIEPMGSTFSVLSSNVQVAGATNVTLVNAAASETLGILHMDMPRDNDTGLDNPYMAQVASTGRFAVLGLQVDRLVEGRSIRLVKIDAEGHELSVLKGMTRLLQSSRATLIVEGRDPDVEKYLGDFGYRFRVLPGSWNRVYEPTRD